MNFNQDFQPPRSINTPSPKRPKRRNVSIVAGLLIAVVVVVMLLSGEPGPDLEASTPPLEISAPKVVLPPQPVRREIQNTVQSGETISALLGDYFTPQEIHNLNIESREVFPFTKICAGQPYRICTTDGEFDSFIYEIDSEELLVISRETEETRMERVPIIYDVKTEMVQGTIKSSLFDAVTEIGEEPELAISLADIFAWDIDFILDLRVGDTFQALVEKRFREGKPAGYGKILAAEFINRKKTFNAVLYQDGDQRASYYDETGENVRKAFLKAPLSFSRISSGFSMKRFHPITNTWKSHPAIDYAAAPGTPIKTVGDGSITRIGYTKGNGNFIEVRHSNGYTTLYLHMKGFARGMQKGKRLSQGQVIGYVGSTGLATGPHLCFRMRKDGNPINPYKVKVPAAKAVAKAQLADFKAKAAPLLARFEESRAAAQMAELDAPVDDSLPVLESAQ
ncbi:MAG TPA: peptidoglycan DD-metalloendopeptidase family protein [Malonomonas sp.]